MTTTIDRVDEDVAGIAEGELLHYVRFLNTWQHLPGDRNQTDRQRIIAGLRSLGELMYVQIRPNGYVEPYPHADFDGPCSGPCCEDYSLGPNKPYLWRCEGRYDMQFREHISCNTMLIDPGQCIDCAS